MSDKIYFQWQNPILRETIYPVRDMKLRHFLLYYYEIDLWAKYKDKKDWPVDKFPEEKSDFLTAQKKAISDAYNAEGSLKTYFRDEVPAVAAKSGNEKNPDVVRLNQLLGNLRRDFRSFFKVDDGEEGQQPEPVSPANVLKNKTGKQLMGDVDIQRSRDRKEKIFVAMRVSDLEFNLKDLKRKLARKQTIIDYSNPKPSNLPELEEERDTLRDIVIPRLQEELSKLKELVAAQNKLEKRKAEFSNRIAEKITDRDEVLKKLLPKRQELEKWESRKRELGLELVRATKHPSIPDAIQYLSSDIYSKIDAYLAEVNTHAPIMDAVRSTLRSVFNDNDGKFFSDFLVLVKQWQEKNLPSSKVDPSWIMGQIGNFSDRFPEAEKRLDRAIASLESGLPSMRADADKKSGQEKMLVEKQIGDRLQLIGILSDSKLRELFQTQSEKYDELRYAFRLVYPAKKASPNRSPAEVKRDLRTAVKKFLEAKTAGSDLEKQLDEINEALCVKREKYLKEFMLERSLTLKDDILPFLSEKYYADLMQFDHDALLMKVFQRIWAEPERFPLWLQYMVIHFSGMRYASAHGSWADPRDLLLSLRTSEIQKQIENELTEIKTKGLLDACCQARLAIYEPLQQPLDESKASSLPDDARAAAQDYRFVKRFQEHYKNQLNSSIESKRSRGYFDMRIDEEGCEIRAMKNEDVLQELTDLHKERHFPDWMWKEIVKLTDLRLTEVHSKEWETLTATEQADRLAAKDKQLAQYREIINDWKSKNLTGWRQEHERSNRLIVTRAVCNEVAEHIQHLRGLVSAAGLTQKPFWYKGEEDRYFEAKAKEEKSSDGSQGRPGTRPYFVRAKDRGDDHHTFEVGASILWLRFVNDSPNEWRIAKPMATREGDELVDPKYRGRQAETGNWIYTMGEPISRWRQKRDQKGKALGPRETQYLRWMHEATVATVADTAEGKVVLTFETTLPYEDPSVSTVGMLKRYLKDLNHDQGEDAYNAAFVGFMPERTLSADDVESMEAMLDWNHIFLKDVVTPAQLEDFRDKYIRNHKPTPSIVQLVDEKEEESGPKSVIGLLPRDKYLQWTESIAQPGTKMYRVRRWGDKALKGGALNVDAVGTTNFQAIGLYNKATNDFGAVKNFIHIYRDDIDRLKALQVNDEYLDKKPDWRSQKMNWLCQEAGSIYMFDDKDDSWKFSPRIRWGTLALGGNLVQVEGEPEELDIKVQGFDDVALAKKGAKVRLKMWRLVGFRSTDWGRPLDELLKDGLVHRCFCAGNRNQINDSPQGIVYSPFFSVADKWDFRGTVQPRALYIPDVYLEEQGSTSPLPKERDPKDKAAKDKKKQRK